MPPPERWDMYAALGEVVIGTNFIPFKVPLKKELLSDVHENERFSPQDAIQKIKEKGKTLGLVIDVNYSDKYYHKGEFCRLNVEHEKIYTYGHFVPKDAVVYRFFDVVEKFSKRQKTEDIVIGVHCTHGVNRTGYIVCRYMVERLGIDPTKAMEAFNVARGYPIERTNYIEDLLTRKHNPEYVIGNHPPVLKEEQEGSKTKDKNKDRYKPWLRQRRKALPMPNDNDMNGRHQQSFQYNYDHQTSDGGYQRGYRNFDGNNYCEMQDSYTSSNGGYQRVYHSYERSNHSGAQRSYNDRPERREASWPYQRPVRHSKSYPPCDSFSGQSNNISRKSRHSY